MNKNIFWLSVLVSFIFGVWIGNSLLIKNNKEQLSLKIGIQASPAMALPMIAKDRGFFEKEGLNVELVEFTAGKFALQAFFGGSLDVAISGDVPVALALMQGNKTSVVAQVVEKTINEVRVVARKDGEVKTAKEYFKDKKRKLATSLGGGPEFFTYEFLNNLEINSKDIEIISQKPEDMPAALISGSVDAISIFDPFAFIAERELAEKATTFTNSDIYSELYVMNVSNKLKENAGVIKKLLTAMIEAEKFAEKNPREARAIVSRYTKLDEKTLESIWGSFVFKITLTEKLLDFWERELDWAKKTKKITAETPAPDFNSVLVSEYLHAIDKTRVAY